MAGSFFDTLYEGLAAPGKLEAQQLQNQENALKIQGEQMALQNQRDFQQAASALTGGTYDFGNTIEQAGQGNPQAQQGVQKLMALYARYFPDKLPQMMNAVEGSVQRGERAKAQMQQRIGSVFGSITDDATLQAAMPEIMQLGGPQALGLQPGGYAVNKARIDVLTNMGMSVNAQQGLDYKYFHEQNQQAQAQQRQTLAEQRLQLQKDRETAWEGFKRQWMADKAKDEARKDALQEQRDGARQAARQNRYTQVGKTDLKAARTLVASDEFTSGFAANLQDNIARDVAQRAKNKLAQSITSDFFPTQDDYDEALNEAFNEVKKEGRITKETSTFLGIPGTSEGKYKAANTQRQGFSAPRAKAAGGTGSVPTFNSMADFQSAGVGQNFIFRGKTYKKTSPTDYEEVK